MLQIGSLLDNKYKILSEIGHGGMSVVYLAINERANKTWAVKEIRKDGVCDFEAVKQGLIVETDKLKRLNHPHLPSIIDVIDMDDSFIIVMDYIEGRSLQSVLKQGGAQPKELVVEWGKQLCDVLGYLHSREPAIIYRDMKPANVMLKPNGDVTLIDFGTAREFKNRAMVEDTTCLGTRGYAAPEQFGGRGQTDARTDIYCLGATLYHLLTGHSPAEPPYEIKPLSYWDANYAGSGLEFIINKCCQQDPNARYQSCAELMYDLENVDTMDYSVQISRRRKWTAFISSIALCLVGVVGMIGFSLAKNSATEQTYDAHISNAKILTAAEEFPSFVETVRMAMDVDPSRYEAYDTLLRQIESDGIFSMNPEYDSILQCLKASASNSNTAYEDQLLASSQEEYADIQLRVGKLLFLMSDGSDDNLKRSVAFFNNALVKGGLSETTDENRLRDKQLAESLLKIGEAVDSLDAAGNPFVESEYDYGNLWNDLQSLYNNNSIDSMGSKAYGIALYNRIAYMIKEHYREFDSYGVSRESMNGLLDSMEEILVQVNNNLTDSEKNHEFGNLISGALSNVTTARNSISAMKGGNG